MSRSNLNLCVYSQFVHQTHTSSSSSSNNVVAVRTFFKFQRRQRTKLATRRWKMLERTTEKERKKKFNLIFDFNNIVLLLWIGCKHETTGQVDAETECSCNWVSSSLMKLSRGLGHSILQTTRCGRKTKWFLSFFRFQNWIWYLRDENAMSSIYEIIFW